MAEQPFLRLVRELAEQRFDAVEVRDLIARLGGPALAVRGFAHARRRAWSSARADFGAALERPGELAALLHWQCGAGLFATRDYARSIAALRRAAELAPRGDRIGIAARARKLALERCVALGWVEEARQLREAIATHDIRGARNLRAHSLELQRQAAIRRRAQQALDSPPETAAAKALALLGRDGTAAARAVLEQLEHRSPESRPPALAALLRLDLLEGELDAAQARATSLAPDAAAQLPERAALALARGELDLARQLTGDPGDDPRLLFVRGLALRSSDPSQAATALEQARTLAPDSLRVGLALAVVRSEQPDRSNGELEHRFAALLELAPALLSDAAASLDVELWTDAGPTVDLDRIQAILERALTLLTANPDLDLLSYAHDGQLRHVPPPGAVQPALVELHRGDAEFVAHHESVLTWALGVRLPRPEPRPEPRPADADADAREPARPARAPAPSLTPAQLEQFLADGFIVLRGAVDPERIRTLREAAILRMRDEPARWIRDYEADGALANFSPDDPATWTRERIDLSGPARWDIAELSPITWAAICDLLGGAARIATRSWGENYILALRCVHALDGSPPPRPPALDQASWHIDDPSPAARLDRIRNGLVGIVLFDEVRSDAGNTWLAPDSVGHVARMLAAHPEGVDLINERDARIAGLCERFYEVAGGPGDVVLMHPLMLHSASLNTSARIRWMANPMVYLEQPLDPLGPQAELSPVELAIRRALKS